MSETASGAESDVRPEVIPDSKGSTTVTEGSARRGSTRRPVSTGALRRTRTSTPARDSASLID